MHILQVINSLDTGGAEKLLLESLPFYLKRNIKISLLLLKETNSPFLRRVREQYPEVEVITIGKRSVYNPFLIFKLAKYIKAPDIVHVHLFPALYWVALAKSIHSIKTKMVFTEHNQYNRRRSHRIFKPFDRICYSKYQSIIAVSETIEVVLASYIKSLSDRIRVVPNGVAIEAIQNTNPVSLGDLGIPKSEKVLLQVSSFTDQKDQATLIRALKHMNSTSHVLLVGVGPTLAANKKLTTDLGLQDRVHFLTTRMDVWGLMKAAHVVVLSTNYEGHSITALEAMASGVPLVASDAPGVRDLVPLKEMLFPPGDDKSLANLLEKLLQDDELRSTSIASNFAGVSEFHIKHTVDSHITLYHTLCPNLH